MLERLMNWVFGERPNTAYNRGYEAAISAVEGRVLTVAEAMDLTFSTTKPFDDFDQGWADACEDLKRRGEGV